MRLAAAVWADRNGRKRGRRDRLLDGDIAQRLLAAMVAQQHIVALMFVEHFSVDGTLIQAWAELAGGPKRSLMEGRAEGSHKSFQHKASGEPPALPSSGIPPAGRNAERDWRGQTRSNDTHVSNTDPDARLARKSDGQASILACPAYPDGEPFRLD